MTTIPQPSAESAVHGDDDDVEDRSEQEEMQDDGPDPLVHLREQLTSGWKALLQHFSILVDGMVDSAVNFLLALCLVFMALACAGVLCLLGCYYLVSGVGIGIQVLTGSVWIAHLSGGVLFLVLPLLAVWIGMTTLKRNRARDYALKYRDLLEQEDAS